MAEQAKQKRNWLQRLLPFAAVAVFGAALWALHRELKNFHFADFRAYVAGLSALQLGLAIAATFAGYAMLFCYDFLALRYVGQRLATARIALTSFIGYAFSLNIGQAALSGGAVRMRLYTGWGVPAGDVARVIAFIFAFGTIGQALVAGTLFTFAGISIPPSLPIPFHPLRWLGVILLTVAAAAIALLCLRRRPIQIRSLRIELPKPRISLPAIAVASADWMLSGVVLFALMPSDSGISLPQFLGIVMLGHIAGVLSMVPGGLGVFETVILHLTAPAIPPETAISALIAFRAIYYLIPFLIAIILMGGHELRSRKQAVSSTSKRIGDWLSPFVPYLLSIMAFVAGSILLLSGAIPAVASRLASLSNWLPLAVVELSHFLGSLVGVGLLLLSGALRRRIDAAYFAMLALLAVGVIASLLKGWDYEEAIILTFIFFAALPCRQRFHRHASLFAMRFTPRRWLGIGLVFLTVMSIGFAEYERIHYDAELWTRFGFKSNAARVLRASLHSNLLSRTPPASLLEIPSDCCSGAGDLHYPDRFHQRQDFQMGSSIDSSGNRIRSLGSDRLGEYGSRGGMDVEAN